MAVCSTVTARLPAGLADSDDLFHAGAAVEEWCFAGWSPRDDLGLVTGYRRRTGGPGWYWAALARAGKPLLHVTEWDVPPRTDPLLVKAHGLWAEHVCEVPMQQWTVANETYAVALADPAEALGRAYGVPSALAFDLEWYATEQPAAIDDGFTQLGVVHGVVELPGAPLRLEEIPAQRWRRWGDRLGPLGLPSAYAHTGVRAPFAFPDGSVADWVLTPDGWRVLGA